MYEKNYVKKWFKLMMSLFYKGMDVSERTCNILDALEPRSLFINTVTNDVTDSLLGIYKDISRGARRIAKMHSKGNPLRNIVAVKEDLAKNLEGRFFPSEIRRHIADNVKNLLVYKSNVDRRPITIEFGLSEDQLGNLEEYSEFVDFILLWLHVCGSYAKDACVKSLTVRMFLTDFPKLLPAENRVTLGPVNVNTGYSYYCAAKGEIVLVRREEWKKVFIHETFHAYGLDFSCDSNKLVSRMKKLYLCVANIKYPRLILRHGRALAIAQCVHIYVHLVNRRKRLICRMYCSI